MTEFDHALFSKLKKNIDQEYDVADFSLSRGRVIGNL